MVFELRSQVCEELSEETGKEEERWALQMMSVMSKPSKIDSDPLHLERTMRASGDPPDRTDVHRDVSDYISLLKTRSFRIPRHRARHELIEQQLRFPLHRRLLGSV